jgi:hypothetical protein
LTRSFHLMVDPRFAGVQARAPPWAGCVADA